VRKVDRRNYRNVQATTLCLAGGLARREMFRKMRHYNTAGKPAG
jgi:hypothetical protein